MRVIGCLLLAIALTACGDKPDGNSPSGEGDLPKCSDVWVNGETLPADYDGCANGGTTEAAVTIDCTDGGEFTTYDDRFFAVLGGKITEADPDSESYTEAYNACAD